jgi:SAM-dependent methyltransferase
MKPSQQQNFPGYSQSDYQLKLVKEIEYYRSMANVHDLPEIFHYWSNKYLVPKFRQFGFGNPKEFYATYMLKVLAAKAPDPTYFISIGSGNCEFEIEIAEKLLASGADQFILECMDLNPHMLDRGRKLAEEKGVVSRMQFLNQDVNSWHAERCYEIIMANQALHHFVELETLFGKIYETLSPGGYFLTDDIIGRNGHMRWPEALAIVKEIWKVLPEKKKYNHQLKRVEIEYDNWDCSKEGFEGIRAQDILPLLIKKFQFDLFIGYGNVIDIFIDRSFGHNFNPENEWDRNFIDRVHYTDEENLEQGIIKPTHMTAAMTRGHSSKTKAHKHLTPEFCLRQPSRKHNPWRLKWIQGFSRRKGSSL